MAKFKITKSTTVAELKEQFSSEFGGVLRVYEGRSEAPEDAALVSLGAKEGDLECRASRTVGKFEEAFQSELGLKVKVYTKDNWVSVLDGITLSTVRAIPKSATKAKMEQFLAYQRDEKEDVAEEAKADEVEIPEEIKGIPLFDIHMKKVEWPFMNKEDIDKHSDELGAFGVVQVCGLDEVGDFEQTFFTGKTDDGMYNAPEFIEWCRDRYEFEHFEAYISDSIKIYGLDKQDYELERDIHQGMIAYTGSEYSIGNRELDTPALFRVQYDENEPHVFSINKNGYYDTQYDNILFDKLVELTKVGKNCPKPKVFNPNDYNFSNGLASVNKDGKWGFIDTKGNLVIDYIYDWALDFEDGIATVEKDGKYGLIDTKGNLVIDCIYDMVGDFEDGIAKVEKDEKCGFVDTKGNFVIDFIYDWTGDFEDGFAVVEKDGKFGFIDTKGNLVIDCIYDDADSFENGVASVMKDGKYGFIDTKGNIVIDCIYDMVGSFSEGLAFVEKDGKYGYIDTKGNIVIDCIYDGAGNFFNGITKVKKDDKEFKIDTKGNVVEE